MKSSTVTRIVVGVVVVAVIGAVAVAGVLGFLIYQHSRGSPFPIADSAALETAPFIDPAANYKIRPPLGWKLEWKIDSSKPVKKHPLWKFPVPDIVAGESFTPNISVTSEASSSANDADSAIRLHQRDLADFHLVSDRHVRINGLSARILDLNYTAKTGWPAHLQQTIIPSGSTVYILTAISHARTWESHRAALESCIASFQVTR